MKKFFASILLFAIFFSFNITNTSAYITIISKEEYQKLNSYATLWDSLNYFAWKFKDKIPASYKYIELKFKGISKNSKVYDSLQVLVYLDLLPNKNIKLNPNLRLSKYVFYKLASKIFDRNILKEFNSDEIKDLKKQKIKIKDFSFMDKYIEAKREKINFDFNWDKELEYKKRIFNDVFKTLKNYHYNRDNLTNTWLLDSAIEWLAKGTQDKFTVYFPPVKNKNFNELLKWEYEWIGAYVDMEKPWVLKIISPISGSPAEKAGLKWWDEIIKVNDRTITKNNSLKEVISWIKGPAWTKVNLTIKRWNKIFSVNVYRAKIVIKDVEYKKLDYTTYYIKLKFFGPTIAKDFKKALEDLKKQKWVTRLIIDLRNNPGGYLDQVVDMLSYFVPKWQSVAYVKYHDGDRNYYSRWYDLIDFSKYKLIILQNRWSASASEIMISTIKDYYPKVTLVWEKTYWKWSVQTIKEYKDNSSLKYTIAKWFSWKTHTWIDGVWIYPTIKMKDDWDYINDKILDKARFLR